MDEIELSNKAKILEELQKNGRALVSEIAKKTSLSRQTVAKIISNMEKKKEIWGYSAIFDSKLLNKKQFIFLVKLDLSSNINELLKRVTSGNQIKENEEKYGFKTTYFMHGTSDLMILAWAMDLIEAKKFLNNFKQAFKSYIIDIDLLEIISTFRNNSITNPKMKEEWTNILI
jgi:DNA-binding Lrp family transcriptional regulator